MNIRPVTQTETALIADLVRKSFQDVAERFGLTLENAPTHPSHCRPDWIEKAMNKGAAYFILELHGRAVGCAALERAGPEVCYLERLAVLPAERKKGLGTALVNRLAREAADQGATRLEIGIIAEQVELRQWYEKLGFVLTRTRHFDHLPFEVAFMSKRL